MAPTTGGFTVTFSDNTSYTITNGKDGAAGADAVKWEIGTDGFWYKNDVKTEYQAVGQAGEAGVAGVSPYIGENGNWFAYNTETKEVEDTGISAAGTSTNVVKKTKKNKKKTRLPGNMSQSFFLLLPLQLL